MNTISVLVLFELLNPKSMNTVRIINSVLLHYRSYDVIKRKAPKNRMREGLYTHYLCIQTKMMMLTPLVAILLLQIIFSPKIVCF